MAAPWQAGGATFAAVCLAAALGKLLGLACAEWRFRQLLDRLRGALAAAHGVGPMCSP